MAEIAVGRMAETAVSGLIKVTLERLSSPVTEQLWLFCGLSEDIEKLRKTLDIIMGVVSDAEEKQQKNRAVSSWLKQLKEAAYDAADILDECETEALRRKLETEGGVTEKVREFFSASNPVVFDFLMAHKVKEIRKRLREIAKEGDLLGLRVGERSSEVGDLRVNETKAREKTVSFIDESRVHGREEDKKRVVDLLLYEDNDKEVSVIPVVGMAGLGKTTLAQWVYNDARVGKHFNLKIWVCVSTDFDVGRLTKAILENATTKKFYQEDVDVIQRLLRDHLSGKKFFLVLDDVWGDNQDKWDQLEGFLQAGAMGSKIIVTTRSQKVASIMGTLPWHCLARLSDDDCWSIFKQRAFGQGRQENPSLVDLGKEITKKCSGIPLIAKALGSLMYFKTEESQWQSVIDNEIWNVLEEDDRTLHALRLSYNDLQPPLKRCFAYCSVFPKDYRMYKEELIKMWIAEGFIQPSPGNRQMEEEIGREYFDELLWRSFFQDAEKDDEGNVSCKMHDLIHDLAQSVSEDARSIVTEDGKITIPKGCRHLFVESRGRERYSGVKRVSITLMPSDRAKKLRTLFLHLPGLHIVSHEFITHLPCLRVLDLGQSSEDMLNSISGLTQLRYLSLDIHHAQFLSNSFSKLHNLQTLRLINCSRLNELPTDMRKMVSLRHLPIPWYWLPLTHMPAEMGKLESLQTLPVFVVGEDSGRNIGQLGNLKYLSGELNIQNLENVTNKVNAQEAKVSEKAYLTSLGLSWSRRIANAAEVLEGLQPHGNLRFLSVKNYGGERLPHWMGGCGLPNLVKLSLSDWRGWEHLRLPAQFRSLKSLRVSGMDAVKCLGIDFYGDGDFPSLEEVILGGMANLEEWSVCNGGRQVAALPRLKRLDVRGCPKLSAVPCFPLLSSLTLSGFEAESLPNCFFQNQLTHLSKLQIYECENLESLSWEDGNVAATLEYIEIQFCPKLRSLFPEEMLSYSLRLRDLHIYTCDGLKSLRLQGLDSLRHLSISSCKNLASFEGGMHHLTALQRLDIYSCEELSGSLADGMEHLASLTHLEIGYLANVTHLPEGLKHATRLQYLYLEDLPNLSALPDWIGNLSSLQRLLINECPNFVSLPSGFQHLINLRYLQIVNCHPELVKRCEKETGEDWHKISHIPDINIHNAGSERQRHGRQQESNSCWISIRIMWTAILNSFCAVSDIEGAGSDIESAGSDIERSDIESAGSERQGRGRQLESNSCWTSIRVMWTALSNSFGNLMGARHAEG